MRKTLLLIVLLFASSLYAQQKLKFNSGHEIIELQVSKEKYFIKFNEKDLNSFQSRSGKDFTKISNRTGLLKTSNLKIKDLSKVKSILQDQFNDKSLSVEPVLIYKDGVEQVCDGELNIKTKNKIDFNLLLKDYVFTVKEDDFVSNQFLVKFDNISTLTLFALAKVLQENKDIEFAEPNFIRFIKPQTSDPYYSSQWAINNQGYFGGVVDADMDVNEAWTYSTGNNIKVAIVDEGVDLNHPDLAANLLPGYDATGNNSYGAPSNNDAHGTACAGIVAAIANNNIGTAGVAYNSKIIPVRIAYKKPDGYWQTNDSWIANGINFAVQSGADVISNSWGGGSPSATVTNAINNAVTNGRSGKGCVVVIATGNDNSSVSYPATLPNVIAVGASTPCDQRKTPTSCDGESWWGSNYGTGVDVVAPGVQIFTSDISGTAGYEYGDYKSNFNGTSSACPNVAGVVALILSARPSLSSTEARQILESSVDKIVGYSYSSNVAGQANGTWNNEVGYGRVNALNAVFKALNLSIIGDANLCSTNNTYTIQNYRSELVTSWTSTPNLTLTNPTNSTVSVIANNSSVSGSGTITATFQNGETISKTIWIGVPSPNYSAERVEFCNFQYRAKDYPGTTQGATYTWQFVSGTGNANASNFYSYGDFAQFTACPPFSIRMKLIASNSCGVAEEFVDLSLNNDDEEISRMASSVERYVVYPNPTNDIINVDLIDKNSPSEKSKVVDGEIFDLMGQSKRKLQIKNDKASFSVKGLINGIYILKIYNNGQVESHKVIVE